MYIAPKLDITDALLFFCFITNIKKETDNRKYIVTLP